MFRFQVKTSFLVVFHSNRGRDQDRMTVCTHTWTVRVVYIIQNIMMMHSNKHYVSVLYRADSAPIVAWLSQRVGGFSISPRQGFATEMISAILVLLFIHAPVDSYLKSSFGDRSRCTGMLIAPMSKEQLFCNKALVRMDLRSHKSVDNVDISPPTGYKGFNTSAQNLERNDNVKEQGLLSKDWEFPNAIRDIRCLLAVNESFVPVIGVHTKSTFIKLRSYLFSQGVYPGVEYKVLNITISGNSKSNEAPKGVATLQGLLRRGLKNDNTKEANTWLKRLFSGQTQLIQTGGSDSSTIVDFNENVSATLETYQEEEDFIELTVRPAYPLIRTLEKKWPVKVR